MNNRITREAIKAKILQLEQLGVPFMMEDTRSRTIIRAEQGWGSWENRDTSFKAKELSFIKTVKAHILKHETYKRVRNTFKKPGSEKRIKYYWFNKNLHSGTVIENVVEIDVKNAYWRTCRLLELIDEHLYQKGLTVQKKTRLGAVGSLARTKYRAYFNGKKYEDRPPLTEKKTAYLWNVISNRVGRLMAKAARAASDDFLFFWVDAIFVKGERAAEVQKIIKDAGYEYSTHPCEWVRVEDTKLVVKCSAKPKRVSFTEEQRFIKNGRQYVRKIKRHRYIDERPFSFTFTSAPEDIVELSADQ